jgi:hypothetical protein
MTKSKKLDELVSKVEDLLARLPDDPTAEVAHLREKVDADIFAAWSTIAQEGRNALSRRSRHSSARLWTPVGLALLAGATTLLAYQVTRPSARLP